MVARTNLARVRSLGAAGSGTRGYWLLKLTSVALLPLTIFLAGFLIAMRRAEHSEVAAGLASPTIAIPLVLFILANAVHMRLGMQNIINDYGHGKVLKQAAVALNIFFCYGVSIACFYFIIKIAVGG